MDALRDWGHAKDFVRAQWMMLQQDQPDDFVIATGEQHSVREFVNLAAARLDMKLDWQGSGTEETATDMVSGDVIVRIDPRYYRPTEVEALLGDPSKAKSILGWEPEISFHALVEEMVDSDLRLAERDALVQREGFETYKHHE
jgi:GDPmannose 4,6-dehydratase